MSSLLILHCNVHAGLLYYDRFSVTLHPRCSGNAMPFDDSFFLRDSNGKGSNYLRTEKEIEVSATRRTSNPCEECKRKACRV